MPQHCKTKDQQKFVKNEYPLSAEDEKNPKKTTKQRAKIIAHLESGACLNI